MYPVCLRPARSVIWMIVAGSTSGVSGRSLVLIPIPIPIPVLVVVAIFGYVVIGMGVIPIPTTFPNYPTVGQKHCFVPSSFSIQIRSPGVYPIPAFVISSSVRIT